MLRQADHGRKIGFVEVAPRDGLQNESVIISTEQKVELIARSIAAGARRIEVASFAHPARVPQMADAEAVIAALPERADVVYIGLVLNKRGALRALATKVDELGAVCVATDSFAHANQGQTALESLEMAKDVVRFATAEGRRAQITIGASFGCPFEGEVDPDHVVAMAVSAAEAGPVEIALADTIGVAVPAQVSALIERVVRAIAPIPVRAHFHNTRGTGIANVWAAIEAGASTIDASIGGLGGCPFAPGAAGNVASEDVAYLFQRSGIDAGLNLDLLIETSHWLGGVMSRKLPGMLGHVGRFPAAA